ncbi:MAG: aminoglycoside phosphotransferase family protein [Proteobacteria bacterium]|nr:aminoglycoside phosphotransferase family protein [Pseudomonadota bacterium]
MDLIETENCLAWAATQIDLLPGTAPTPLPATSSRVWKLETRSGPVILRAFIPSRWREEFPGLADREYQILDALRKSSLPAPEPIAAVSDDQHGELILMSCVPGIVNLPIKPATSWLTGIAVMLAEIHAQTAVSVRGSYTSWNTSRGKSAPAWWKDVGVWSDAQAQIAHQPAFTASFIHRDFHPCNLLWRDGTLSGVVDWINACMGPPSVDVAHCRLNLVAMYGEPEADVFLAAYLQRRPGFEHHPYWDLDAGLGAMPEPSVYPPWISFGLNHLREQDIGERLIAFVTSRVTACASYR